MILTCCDFDVLLAGIQSGIVGLATIKPAAIKTYGRMVGKMAAASDHRYVRRDGILNS